MALSLASATARIARQLSEVEQATDQAILKSAELMASLVRARAETGVVVHTGQWALIRLVKAQQALVEGSNNIFRVHDEMSGIGREMGVFDEREATTPPSGLGGIETSAEAA